MKIIITLLLGIIISLNTANASAQGLLSEFEQYTELKNNINPDNYPEIIEFINTNTPLAHKLRKKWLYHLARKRDWDRFYSHFRDYRVESLKCYYHIAQYRRGLENLAFAGAKSLWLSSKSQPRECNLLFALWMKDDSFDERYIYQRLKLALETKNLTLARYLIKKLNNDDYDYSLLIPHIHNKPHRIGTLTIEDKQIEAMLTLYGLKRLTAKSIDKSIKHWNAEGIKEKLNLAQQQSYLKHLSLHMALRDHPKVDAWFDKVKPEFYTDPHVEWQIRASLRNEKWPRVKYLIGRYNKKDKLCWQYWYARALEQTGHSERAQQIFLSLAKSRHYYGFLASHKIEEPLSFQDASNSRNENVDISQFDEVIDEIKEHYTNNKKVTAAVKLGELSAVLTDDQVRELAKEVASWQWHARAMYLISKTPFKDDLSIRFPLAYKELVTHHAKSYEIPKEFVFAIMRQESTFRKDVVSSAGARGLMQLMPRTAYLIARKNAIRYRHKKQLFHPHKNIQIGVAYLNHLSKRFKKHPVLMAAAYNAGPRKVREWMREHKPQHMDIWIETLPWRETRNYLKNVTSFYAVYQYRLYGKSNLNPILTHFR
jgi:soluble lytic murein transglycosylase